MLGQYAHAYVDNAARELEETEEYEQWATEIIEFPPPDYSDWSDPDEKPGYIDWIKVGIGAGIAGMIGGSQDQSKVQEGETDLEFEPVPDPEPNPDPNPDPEPNPEPDPEPGSSSWTPPSDMGKFTLDLKQYFPFSIPFDMYAFFTCLNAEPVAPVIEWIIPLPGGKIYPFEIDLSAFDSVAQILRRMQLLLFCVGLAFKTRDLIKG